MVLTAAELHALELTCGFCFVILIFISGVVVYSVAARQVEVRCRFSLPVFRLTSASLRCPLRSASEYDYLVSGDPSPLELCSKEL